MALTVGQVVGAVEAAVLDGWARAGEGVSKGEAATRAYGKDLVRALEAWPMAAYPPVVRGWVVCVGGLRGYCRVESVELQG